MKTTVAVLFTLVAATFALAQSPTSGRNGWPEIIVDRAKSDIFPESWQTSKVGAKAQPLSAAEQRRCREIVETELAKYPAVLLSTNLKKVYVVARLEYGGVATGGTNARSAVYLVSDGGRSPAEMEKNFHAEFSSILLRNFPNDLDKRAWQQINPPDFSYRGSGVQAIKDKQASLSLRKELHEEGFLNEYAKASLEEDFNSLAARLLMGNATLWSAIEQYPKVKAKADLVIAFYGKLDPSFTKEYFLQLRSPPTK